MKAITPIVLCFEALLMRTYPSKKEMGAVGLLCLGVALSTVTDNNITANLLGMAVAAVAVCCSAIYLVTFSFLSHEIKNMAL